MPSTTRPDFVFSTRMRWSIAPSIRALPRHLNVDTAARDGQRHRLAAPDGNIGLQHRRRQQPTGNQLRLQPGPDELLGTGDIPGRQARHVPLLGHQVFRREPVSARQRAAGDVHRVGNDDLDRHIDFPRFVPAAANADDGSIVDLGAATQERLAASVLHSASR